MKQEFRMLKIVLAAVLFATTSLTLLAAPGNTGIQGQAVLYISYGTATEVEGVWIGVGDVELPVVSSFRILSANSGHEIGRFTTDQTGAFTVPLKPGKYIVVPDTLTFPGPFGYSVPTSSFEVTVSAKKFSYALILYYQDGPHGIASGLVQ